MILGLRTTLYGVRPDQFAAAKEWYARLTGSPPYFDPAAVR